jgi:capsular exopolysaccharide synthesis family protein
VTEIKKDAILRQATLPRDEQWAGGNLLVPMERELTLADIWLVIWKRKLVITLVAASTFLLGALYTFLKKPVYESAAQIQIDPSQRGSLGLDDIISQKLSSGDFDSRLQTQVKILQSDTVSMQVIKNLDLAHKEAFAGKKLAASIRVSDPLKMNPDDRDALLEIFKNSEIIEALPKTQMIGIRFRSTDPELATNTVNAVLSAYVQRNFESRYQGTMQVSEWLSQQMQDIKADASKAQRELADFQKQNDILGTDEKNNIITDRLGQLNQQLMDAEADRIAKEARYRLASTGNPELVAAVVPSTTLQILRTQEADLKAQYAQLDAKFGSGYPKVRELQAQLARLSKAIAEEIGNVEQRLHDEFLAAAKSEDMLRKRFDTQKQEAFRLNESAVRYATLRHEVESSQALFDTLQLKLKEAGVTAGLASADINIVDRGKVPAHPVLPRKALNLALSLFGGLLGGFILAFVMESLDDTLQTSEQVEVVSSLPVLAVVPQFATSHNGSNGAAPLLPGAGLGIMSLQRPQSQFADACRAVCSSFLLSSVDRRPRLLIVTSAMPAEGKSVISCNLAISLAQRGGRVLLVDADLRRSSLHKQLNLDRTLGLSSVLIGATESDAVQNPLAEVPNLYVLPAGPRPPSPVEMLASDKMRQFLKRWATEYDYVVVDTAPILPVIDTLPLAAAADAVILVVRSGWSRNTALIRMRDQLHRANAHISGVVVNGIDLKLEHYYSDSSRYGYGYSKSNYRNYYQESDANN